MSTDPADTRTGRWQVALLFALAVAVRIVAARRTAVIFADGPSFIELAERLGAGDWEGALRHPYHLLYPALLVVTRPLVGDLETAGVVWSVLGGALAVIALHRFLRDAFDPRIAWIGGGLLAVAPYAVRFSSDVQSDGVYLGLFLLGVAWLWRAVDRATPAAALCAGASAGLAYLTRPEGVGIVLVGAFLAVCQRWRGGWTSAGLARWLAALAAGFGAFAAPYLWALSTLHGSWLLSGKKSLGGLLGVIDAPRAVESTPGALIGGLVLLLLFALALRPRLARPTRPMLGAARPVGGLAQLRLARLGLAGLGAVALGIVALGSTGYGGATGREYVGVMVSSLGPAFALWAAVGLLVRRSQRQPDRALFIGAFLGLYGLVLAGLLLNYGYLSRRHALPPLALLLGYSAIGTTVLARALRSGSRRLAPGLRLAPGWSLALALLMVCSTELPKTFRRHRDDALAERRAAEWLRGQAMPAGQLAATKLRTAYYADRDWVPLRYEGGPTGVAALRVGSARYAIVDRELESELEFAGGTQTTGFLELHRVEAAGELAVVYQIVRRGDL